jgi:hypothetical protein
VLGLRSGQAGGEDCLVRMKQRRTRLRRALAVDVTGRARRAARSERRIASEGAAGTSVMDLARRAGWRSKSKRRVRLS